MHVNLCSSLFPGIYQCKKVENGPVTNEKMTEIISVNKHATLFLLSFSPFKSKHRHTYDKPFFKTQMQKVQTYVNTRPITKVFASLVKKYQ